MENLPTSSASVSTTSNSYHNLDNLPDLVYYYILKNLDLDDILELRLVNKTLNSIVHYHSIIELSFFKFGIPYWDGQTSNWFSTTKPIKRGNQLDISKLWLLTNPPYNFNVFNLKYLRIKNIDDPFKLDDLNKFTKLQILETPCSFKRFSNHLIKLPDLRALSVYRDYLNPTLESQSLVIDAPKLNSLSVRYFKLGDDIIINHPHSIKYLQTSHYYDYDNADWIIKFINLECFETSYANDLLINRLMNLNNLKKLRLNCYQGSSYINDVLKNLFKSKKVNLELVLNCVKINDIDKFISDNNRESSLKFQLRNFSQLEDNLNYVRSLYYNDLMSLINLLPGYQLSDLFSKYTNIQMLIIMGKIKRESLLIPFIEGCPNLSQLLIRRSSLSQSFYDQLPEICSLSILSIKAENLNLNFEFFIRMRYLTRFQIDQDVLISKQLSLNSLKRLKIFDLKINNREFKIRKVSKDVYSTNSFKYLDLPDDKYITHDKLIEWTNKLRTSDTRKRETRSMTKKRKLSIED